jgi:steroid 5-alpha reductase family enzyme
MVRLLAEAAYHVGQTGRSRLHLAAMSLDPVHQIVFGLLIASTTMVVLWLVQRRTGNAGIVDVGWTAGVGAVGVFFAATSDGDLARRLLAGTLIGIWSARLALYLFVNRVVGQPEEGRYVTLRKKWGERAAFRLFLFFQTQAVFVVVFALPVLVAAHSDRTGLDVWDLLGAAVWLVAVTNTTLADWQLARFKGPQENRGKTCREGWWRYSRHPNYFFEWLHWWSYAALSVGSAWWFIPFGAPLVMLYFLLFVTGIPPTEAQAVASRGDDYRAYQRTTSPFVPWFPKTKGRNP